MEIVTSDARLWKKLLPGLSIIKNPEKSSLLKCFFKGNVEIQSLRRPYVSKMGLLISQSGRLRYPEFDLLLNRTRHKFIYFSAVSSTAYSLDCVILFKEIIGWSNRVKFKEISGPYDLEKETESIKIVIYKEPIDLNEARDRLTNLRYTLPNCLFTAKEQQKLVRKVAFTVNNVFKATLLGALALLTDFLL